MKRNWWLREMLGGGGSMMWKSRRRWRSSERKVRMRVVRGVMKVKGRWIRRDSK